MEGLEKIPSKQVLFVRGNYKNGEIYDGIIQWNSNLFYFKFRNEFDIGNRYIVYDKNNNPVAYFSVLTSEDDISDTDIYMDDINF